MDGKLQIHYLANLKAGNFTIGYVAKHEPDQGSFSKKFYLHPVPLPEIRGDRLIWPLEGAKPMQWNGYHDRTILLQTDRGRKLSWNPVIINGRICDQSQAVGYVEKIDLEFAPWRLGLKRLRWGRFCGSQHSVVWIQWRGEYSKDLVLVDGKPQSLIKLGPTTAQTESCRVLFEKPSLVVDEQLGLGALSGFPLINKINPANFLAGRERKWQCCASLFEGETKVDEGNVVFEQVDWQ